MAFLTIDCSGHLQRCPVVKDELWAPVVSVAGRDSVPLGGENPSEGCDMERPHDDVISLKSPLHGSYDAVAYRNQEMSHVTRSGDKETGCFTFFIFSLR